MYGQPIMNLNKGVKQEMQLFTIIIFDIDIYAGKFFIFSNLI